jgi:hypothetical protein
VSFVNVPRDVTVVGERIRAAGKSTFGMILKLGNAGRPATPAGDPLRAPGWPR